MSCRNGWLALLVCTVSLPALSQDRLEVPGDHFSLEGALELFRKSGSPEEFERLLNSEDSKVNNLDLNGDGNIDYIRVIDRHEGNIHTFTLQAVVSATESQDVAVIELEKLDNGKAVLQITGDADIYGTETIIEPTEEVRINAGTSTARSVVNVWTWPSVQYVYGPYYSSWVSPWSWSMRPLWWRTWRPVGYYVYSPWWDSYRPYYSVCSTHRIVYAPRIYLPYRTTSVIVYNRHHGQIDHFRSDWRSNGYRGGRSSSGYSGGSGRQHRGSNQNWRNPSWSSNDRRDDHNGGRQDGERQDNRLHSGNNNKGWQHGDRNDFDASHNAWRENRNEQHVQRGGTGAIHPERNRPVSREGNSGGWHAHNGQPRVQHMMPSGSGASGNHNVHRQNSLGGKSGGGAATHRRGRE